MRVMFAVAVALPPCGTLTVTGVTPRVKLCAVVLNVAVINGAAVTAKLHVGVVPLQGPPDQPANALPAAGVAVSVTLVPNGNAKSHTVPQLTPAGLDVTVPVPVPARATLACARPMLRGMKTNALVLSGPVAKMLTLPPPAPMSAAAETVRMLESVPPFSEGGLNVAVTPLGRSLVLSVSGRS